MLSVSGSARGFRGAMKGEILLSIWFNDIMHDAWCTFIISAINALSRALRLLSIHVMFYLAVLPNTLW